MAERGILSRSRAVRWTALVVTGALLGACSEDAAKIAVPGRTGAVKNTASVRAGRRAFDGAPPTIPHEPFGIECRHCHNAKGMSVTGVGFAPASPHEDTPGLSALANCRQCHVFRNADDLFRENAFAGLRQDLRPGPRAFDGAPPALPHPIFMRENCLSCHAGPAAREEIRCSHPERSRCLQCHLPVREGGSFVRD